MATFSLTVTSGDVAATLTDYPAYVDLSEMPASFWSEVTNGGGDIRVYSDAGLSTELAREVVTCATATDTGEVHVKVPSLTTSTVLYITVDGASTEPASGATYGRNNVWTDYEVVYHGEMVSSVVIDSTGNYTATKYTGNTPTNPAGKVGDALSPNSAYWDTGMNPQTTIGTGDFTMQYWNNFSTDSARRVILGASRDGTFNDALQMLVYESAVGNQNTIGARAGTSGFVENRGTAANGTYKMSHATRAGTTLSQYIDGTSIYSASNSEWGVNLGGTVSPVFMLGALYTSGATVINAGSIDEIRVRGSILSANWITTEYNNQSDVAGFWTIAEASSFTPSPMLHLLQMM